MSLGEESSLTSTITGHQGSRERDLITSSEYIVRDITMIQDVYWSENRRPPKPDPTGGIVCLLRGLPEYMVTDGRRNYQCKEEAQINANFIYERHEELISKFISIRYSGQEDYFEDGKHEFTLCIPHALSKLSALYREPSIKARIGSHWVHLPTEETVGTEEFKDVRFVSTTIKGDIPKCVCVVSSYKKDIIKFTKQPTRNTSSVDQRLTIKSERGTFLGKKQFTLQVQPMDSGTVGKLQSTAPNGRCLMGSSNIISIDWGGETFHAPISVNLPIPPNPVKMKKMLAQTNETKEGSDKKKKNNRPDIDSNKSKWYMGLYGDEENDNLLMFSFDHSSETWSHVPDMVLTELRKDLLSFHMNEPIYKFVVLRCRVQLAPVEAKKLLYRLEDFRSQKAVKFMLFQSPREHSQITVHCVNSQKADAFYDELYTKGWRFYGAQGPPTSREIMVKEGQVFEINFRGNIKFDEGFHPPGKRILMHYNCQLSCQCHFTITEMDKHLQKSYDFYKGLCVIQQVHLESKTPFTTTEDKTVSRPSSLLTLRHLTSTASRTSANKQTSIIPPENKKKVMCELMIQLAKGVENGPQTPPASKLCLSLEPIYHEAINIVAPKLGKEWEALGKSLGLTNARIEAIRTRNKAEPDRAKEDMLLTWMKRQARGPDRLPVLYYALMNCGRIDLAYKMEDLYCDDGAVLDEGDPQRRNSGASTPLSIIKTDSKGNAPLPSDGKTPEDDEKVELGQALESGTATELGGNKQEVNALLNLNVSNNLSDVEEDEDAKRPSFTSANQAQVNEQNGSEREAEPVVTASSIPRFPHVENLSDEDKIRMSQAMKRLAKLEQAKVAELSNDNEDKTYPDDNSTVPNGGTEDHLKNEVEDPPSSIPVPVIEIQQQSLGTNILDGPLEEDSEAENYAMHRDAFDLDDDESTVFDLNQRDASKLSDSFHLTSKEHAQEEYFVEVASSKICNLQVSSQARPQSATTLNKLSLKGSTETAEKSQANHPKSSADLDLPHATAFSLDKSNPAVYDPSQKDASKLPGGHQQLLGKSPKNFPNGPAEINTLPESGSDSFESDRTAFDPNLNISGRESNGYECLEGARSTNSTEDFAKPGDVRTSANQSGQSITNTHGKPSDNYKTHTYERINFMSAEDSTEHTKLIKSEQNENNQADNNKTSSYEKLVLPSKPTNPTDLEM